MITGWIRLQNGYYLPIASGDGEVSFLAKISTRSSHSSGEIKEAMGSETPLFRGADQGKLSASMLNGDIAIADSATSTLVVEEKKVDPGTLASRTKEGRDSVRAAVHMDAMAFGMGCCCLQITFQATDIDESRFIYDQLAVMAPM